MCFKVPTGGGKTYLACCAVLPIVKAICQNRPQVVVWLVPSNAILEQTVQTLQDKEHPYRNRLDVDFQGRVEVCTKDELLNGKNFNPTSVREQLTLCVLSYDSLRSAKKDGRLVYRENSALADFATLYPSAHTVEGADDTALIQALNGLNPIVIVDESHNAESDLSVEMLNNLDPSFVLDLTATPKANSNIISFVDARALKEENMVKLPVIVYNRNDQADVLMDALTLRGKLEEAAQAEMAASGRYIRPIILFQAQPKGRDQVRTFTRIKEDLLGLGIPNDEIAIKTADINELRGVDLKSPSCKIRYIITINALKEGWDCPFAYILATLANKTSSVDVEQILGRVLRLPDTQRNTAKMLNMADALSPCPVEPSLALGYYYIVANEEATVVGFTDPEATELILPRILGGVKVTAIGDRAFATLKKLARIALHENVKTIASDAFPPSLRVITGPAASFAQAWALEHGIAFEADATGVAASPEPIAPEVTASPEPTETEVPILPTESPVAAAEELPSAMQLMDIAEASEGFESEPCVLYATQSGAAISATLSGPEDTEFWEIYSAVGDGEFTLLSTQPQASYRYAGPTIPGQTYHFKARAGKAVALYTAFSEVVSITMSNPSFPVRLKQCSAHIRFCLYCTQSYPLAQCSFPLPWQASSAPCIG